MNGHIRQARLGAMQWAFYDRTGRLVRELAPEEVPAGVATVGPSTGHPPFNMLVLPTCGGMLFRDPDGAGYYLAVPPSKEVDMEN